MDNVTIPHPLYPYHNHLFLTDPLYSKEDVEKTLKYLGQIIINLGFIEHLSVKVDYEIFSHYYKIYAHGKEPGTVYMEFWQGTMLQVITNGNEGIGYYPGQMLIMQASGDLVNRIRKSLDDNFFNVLEYRE